jgi:hypothetical protein
MNIASILQSILRLAFPKLPTWSVSLLLAIFTEALAIVREVEAANGFGKKSKLSGAEKFELVSDNIEAFLVGRTAGIPGWSEINPARRAKLIGGLIELAVFIVDIADGELDMSNTRPTRAQIRLLRRRGYKQVGSFKLPDPDAPVEADAAPEE